MTGPYLRPCGPGQPPDPYNPGRTLAAETYVDPPPKDHHDMSTTPVQPDLMGGTSKQARDLRPGDTITLGPDQPSPFNAPDTTHLTVTGISRDGATVTIEATRQTPPPTGTDKPMFWYAVDELDHARITDK